MSLKEAAALAPILGLDSVLPALSPSNYTLDTLIASFPAFFGNLSDILTATPKDTIQAFFSWKVIQATYTYVKAPEVKPYTRFLNQLGGKVCASANIPIPKTLNYHFVSNLSVGSGRRNRTMEDVY